MQRWVPCFVMERGTSLFYRLIELVLYARADVQRRELIGPAMRIDAIADEYIDHLMVRIYPSAGASEARMSIDAGRSQFPTVALVEVLHIGFVESQATMADLRRGSGEEAHSRFTKVALAMILTAVEQHLVDLCHLLCSRE